MLSRWRKEFREGRLRMPAEERRSRTLKVGVVREIRRLAHQQLQEEHALLKKGHPVLFRTKADVFAFIAQEQTTSGVTRLCRCYGVTWAGYYAWRHRSESRHQAQDRVLTRVMITAIFRASRGTYGSPRVHRELRDRGRRVSRRRVDDSH